MNIHTPPFNERSRDSLIFNIDIYRSIYCGVVVDTQKNDKLGSYSFLKFRNELNM